MKKIIFSTNDAKRVLEVELKIIQIFKKKGHEVFILCEKDDFYHKLKNSIDNVIPLNVNSKKISILSDIKLIFEYYNIFKKIKPDIIFSSTIKPNIYGSIASSFLKIKSISKISGLGSSFQKSIALKFISKLLYRISLKKNIKVFFQNKSDISFFTNNNIIHLSKASLVPSGINVPQEKNLYNKNDNKITKFLYLGRPISTKGINEFLESSNIMLRRYENVEIHLAGDSKSIDSKIISKKILTMHNKYEKRFFFHEYQKNLNDFIRKFDCLVMPSYREGMSNVLLLAGANSIPSICTDVPGCREIIIDDFNGLLCKPKSVEDLFLKMKKFYHLDIKKRYEMSMKSYEHINNKFSLDKLEKFYLNIILNI
tara:strand:+ start:21760 stop:22866 length:1107 start_codon:yes stop_codon:yes gene_type:complete